MTPAELSAATLEDFNFSFRASTKLARMESKLATYRNAQNAADEIANIASKSLLRNLTAAEVGGFVPQAYADAVVMPLLEEAYELAAADAMIAQDSIYAVEKIKLRAVASELDVEKAQNLCNAIVNATDWHEINTLMTQSVKNFISTAVNETLEANNQRESELGFKRRIRRYSPSGCCDWCESVSGDYDYDDVPDGFYARHTNCTCLIEPINFTAKREWAGNKYSRK